MTSHLKNQDEANHKTLKLKRPRDHHNIWIDALPPLTIMQLIILTIHDIRRLSKAGMGLTVGGSRGVGKTYNPAAQESFLTRLKCNI